MTKRAFATLAMLMVVGTWAAFAGQFDPTKKVDPSQIGNPNQYAAAILPAGWTDLGARAKRGEILACVSHLKDKDHPTPARIMVHVVPNAMKVTPDDIHNPEQFFPSKMVNQLQKAFTTSQINLAGNPGIRGDEDQDGVHHVQVIVLITQPDRLLYFSASCPSADWAKYEAAIDGCLASIQIL